MDFIQIKNFQGFQFKIETEEDPELTPFCIHTKATCTNVQIFS